MYPNTIKLRFCNIIVICNNSLKIKINKNNPLKGVPKKIDILNWMFEDEMFLQLSLMEWKSIVVFSRNSDPLLEMNIFNSKT